MTAWPFKNIRLNGNWHSINSNSMLQPFFSPVHQYLTSNPHACLCMSVPGILISPASRSSPPPHFSYFGMPVPGICSNSSHPAGIGMHPPPPPLHCLSLSILCMLTHVWSSQHRPCITTAGIRRTAYRHIYWIVTTKPGPGCSAATAEAQSWQIHGQFHGSRFARPRTTPWVYTQL